jgi:NOL1/NOP2/fmu family ribosome biogenesis protein
MEKAGFFELSGSERKDFTTSFEIFSGYPLEKYLELNHRVLVRHNNRIFIFPSLLLDRFRTLPVQSAGILLGEEEPDGFIPSQEWVLRFGADCPKIIAILDEDQFKVFVTGGDLVDYSDPSNIDSPLRIVMDSQRLVLGRGKMISGTLKNLSNRQFT